MTASYETDFYGWTLEQADLIRSGHSSKLDFENLLEEIESMGRSEKRELESSFTSLFAELLKWKYQPLFRSRIEIFIKAYRRKAKRILNENLSLKTKLSDIISNAYDDSIFLIHKEAELNIEMLPQECPWDFDEFISDTFYP